MLRLTDITKDYETGSGPVHVLRGITLDFRRSEFVTILGQSGCGKTTLLNVLGGLDRYTSGDLVIDGRSTSSYRESDWDAYRNHKVGFVFQSYNLIQYQSVLANVELALRISGVSRRERQRRAAEALGRVGLGDQIRKKPIMMSGGQMQRVAIARALVNDPAIVLADEPTGALDSETSVQVMDLLAEVARDRLVIMVTHNPELAERYATRIIRLKDGVVLSDSNPPAPHEAEEPSPAPKRARLSMGTALGLSAANLWTKKGRTFLTALAGAIGIIGIALIQSLSTGMNRYIADTERDTMGSYPIQLEHETFDLSSLMEDMRGGAAMMLTKKSDDAAVEDIKAEDVVARTVSASRDMTKVNDLGAFDRYLNDHYSEIGDSISAVEYGYDVTPYAYRMDGDDLVRVSPTSLSDYTSETLMSAISGDDSSAWTQLPESEALMERDYEVLDGRYPDGASEAALVLGNDGTVSDFTLYTMGALPISDMRKAIADAEAGDGDEAPDRHVGYSDVIGLEYSVLPKSALYERRDDEDGFPTWEDMSGDDAWVAKRLDGADKVRIVGVIRLRENVTRATGIGYTSALTDRLMGQAAKSEPVRQQIANPSRSVITGRDFADRDDGASGDASQRTGARPDAADAAVTDADANAEPDTDANAEPNAEDPANTEPNTEDPNTEAPVTHRVAFLNYDGSNLSDVAEVEEGGSVTNMPLNDPTRPDDRSYRYAFIGWRSSADRLVYMSAGDMPPVTRDVAYVAFYYAYPLPEKAQQQQPQQQQQQQAQQPQQTIAPDALRKMLGTGGVTPEQIAKAMSGTRSGTDLDTLGKIGGIGDGGLSDDQVARLMGQYGGGLTDEQKAQLMRQYAGQQGGLTPEQMVGTSGLTQDQVRQLMGDGTLTDDQMRQIMGGEGSPLTDEQMRQLMGTMASGAPADYASTLSALGYASPDQPDTIDIYPVDFEGKDAIQGFIDGYNDQVGDESEKVSYNDMVGLLTQSLTSIVDVIKNVLLLFVSISLVVSSITILILTLVSVLERQREIGLLRSLGVSKRGVTRIFSAENIIEGLASGIVGIGASAALIIPINAVISSQFDVDNLAVMRPESAAGLIALSVAIAVVAGFIPSRSASKKEPAEVLRSE